MQPDVETEADALPETTREQAVAEVARRATEVGIRRVHMLAWRDYDDPEAGGSEVHAHEIAKVWTEAGLEVLMRTSYAVGRPRVATRDGYEVVRKAGRYLVFPRAALAEITRSHGPRDAVVEIWNGVPFLSPVWTRSPKIVVIHHVHAEMWRMALPPMLARLGNRIEEKWAPPFYRDTLVVTPSESSRDDIIERLGLRRDRVQVVHNGIGSRFVPGADPTAPRRHEILAVGRLVPVKRFDMLVRSAAEARRSVPDLTLTIVGDGYERERIETQIQRLGAQDWIRLTRHVSNEALLEHYQRARAVASASVREGWGLTLTEAAACGTPSVATRVVGHIDTVADGFSGILVDDEHHLADALARVCLDDAYWQKLVEGAISHSSRFSWNRTAVGIFSALADEAAGWGNRGRTGRWR